MIWLVRVQPRGTKVATARVLVDLLPAIAAFDLALDDLLLLKCLED